MIAPEGDAEEDDRRHYVDMTVMFWAVLLPKTKP